MTSPASTPNNASVTLSDAVSCNTPGNSALNVLQAEDAGFHAEKNQALSDPIQLRQAKPADRESLFLWRNHPEVRHYSLNSAEIAWEEHGRWLEKTLASPERILLIAEDDNQPVGVLRYDIENDQATVSIYLVPEQMGKGYGARLLQVGTDWLQQHAEQRAEAGFPAITRLLAEIRPNNAASIRAFEKAGFKPSQTTAATPEILTYEYTF